jgi:hypothetical protein
VIVVRLRRGTRNCNSTRSRFSQRRLQRFFSRNALEIPLPIRRARKYLDKNAGDHIRDAVRNMAQTLREARFVDSPNLVERGLTGLSEESQTDSRRISAKGRSQWDDDDGCQVFVHLVRRDDEAGPCLTNFRALRGVERNQPHLTLVGRSANSGYHFHSFRSKAFVISPRRASLP